MSSSEGRRISPVRVLAVLAIVAGLAGLGVLGWDRGRGVVEDFTARTSDTWFAPYVDVTLQPSFAFEDPETSPAPTTVLGFVVPDTRDPCTPTWGTQYDLDGAARELDLDRRIARVRERGGDVVVSFGGVINSELAVACTDRSALTAAYRSVIERYAARTIDLDIEGAALADAPANARRAAAIGTLQREAPADDPLRVWLTLPVTPGGLLPDALAVVEGMLEAGVDLTGVNVMAMNYGASRADGVGMGQAATDAARAANAQLVAAHRRAGRPLSAEQAWPRLGVTAMVGRNDVEGEVFTAEDAGSLADFAERVGLGRVSIWSANRDAQCGTQEPGGWQVLPTCSGTEQEPREFTRTFLDRLDGSASEDDPPPEARQVAAGGRVGDDPRVSPYPVWRSDREYREGEKVVWLRTVYEAKWWTRDVRPDAPVADEWDTPWRAVGPVLPSDARTAETADEAAPPRWSADAVYLRGDRVRQTGYLYEARWRTQGEEPVLDPDLPDSSAWVVIGRAVVDLPPVFESYPEWSATAAYAFRDRVTLGEYVYESRRAVSGVRPEPTPPQPGRAAWKIIGTRSAPGAAGGSR